MALREYLDIRFSASGGLNFDADPLYRKGGDYSFAKNIQHLTHFGGTTFNIQPTLGNVEAYTLPAVVAQNAIIRIYIDSSVANDYTWAVTNPNGTITTTNSTVMVVGDINNSLTFSQNAFIFRLNNAPVQTYNISTVVTGTNTGYVELEITTVPGWGYSVESVGVNESDIIIVQEAIDLSLVGNLIHIGRYDLNGDVIIWSTPQTQLPSDLTINNISASPNAPLTRITIIGHGLQTGEMVVVKNAGAANGQWIVNVIDADNFDLLGSVFIAGVTTGTVTINPTGVGEIGVAQKNDNDQTWTYITLLRSREFNFNTKKQPKTLCERNDILASFYWTDNYNVPRALEYSGAYMTNGALSVINPLGQYEYGTIGLETILIRNTVNAHLTYEDQLQTGGNLYAGNHSYPFRFVTENGSYSLWSDPSQLINVYTSFIPTPAEDLYGNNAYDTTGKINQLRIDGIIPNLYKWVEIANIYYADGVPVGTIIGRFLLNQQTSQVFQHTGFETTTQTLDIASLLEIQADIQLAKNIDVVSNRLILSNTTTAAQKDMTDFARSVDHSLIRQPLDSVLSRFLGNIRAGEFELPGNLFSFAGYMLQEIYRFGFKFKLKNGATTSTFWVDDIKFDDNPINTGNPFGDNRRISPLPSLELTDPLATVAYSFGVDFVNIDWDFLIEGIPLRDIVDEIIVERVEMTDDFIEVKGSGVVCLGISFPFDAGYPGYIMHRQNDFFPWNSFGNGDTYFYASNDINSQDIIDYVFMEGDYVNTTSTNPLYPSTGVLFTNNAERKFMSIYLADELYGNSQLTQLPGDQLIVYGAPGMTFGTFIGQTGLANFTFLSSALKEFTGYTGVLPTYYDVDEMKYISKNDPQGVQAIAGRRYSKQMIIRYDHPVPNGGFGLRMNVAVHLDNPTSSVIHTTADVAYQGSAPDFGLYMVQYYRPKANKFGNIDTSKYIPCGAWLNSTNNSVTVFGGDVMTQKTWLRHRIPDHTDYLHPTGNPALDNDDAAWNDVTVAFGFGGGVAFYAQNRVNSSMANRLDSTVDWKYPAQLVSEAQWLFPRSPSPVIVYNKGYNIYNNISLDEAYDPNLKRSNKQPARIWWSDMKPENSIVDNYRTFLPLNFKDLQLVFGEIQEHKNVNSQLMTWQDGHYELQYFDSTGLLVTNAQEAVLGNAGVMTQRGSALSTYGTSHGFSVIKGKTQGGKDSAYWMSTKYGKVMKHDPSQGTTVVSDVQFMRSFFNNNLTFAGLYDTPADGRGIHGIWDDINSEVIWTVRANKDLPTWVFDSYPIGAEVIHGQSGFHEIPDIYISLIINNTTTPDPTSLSWRLVEKDDPLYYNWYTVAYNEVKNKFTTFYSYMPKIYLKRGKSFLSPRPVDNESIAYEHLRGEYCVWYGDGTTELAERWSIEGMAINEQPNIDKSVKALLLQTQVVPDRIQVNTKNYSTFMVAADCEQRMDQWAVAVKNDTRTSPTGANDGDTSTIFGSYAEVSLSGPPRIFQLLDNFILKVRAVSRLFNN